MSVFRNLLKNDPVAQGLGIVPKTRRKKRKKTTRGKLSVSERRIVNAVSRRVNTRKKKR